MTGIHTTLHGLGASRLPALFMLGLLAWPLSPRAQPTPSYADLVPLFAERCLMCHSGENAPLGLRLDSYQALLEGSSKGPVVVAGQPEQSELIHRVKGSRQPRMPLTGPPFLSDGEIAALEAWVANGLPEGAPVAVPEVVPERPAAGEAVTYRHVAPLFARYCVKCHTENGLMGPAPEQLRLTSYREVLATGERARVVPGHPRASELLRRIRGQARPRMPYDGPPFLTEEEAQLVEDWIAQGARDAEGRPAGMTAGARIRLHGVLEPGWLLNGVPLRIGADTRIDKSPRPGDYVQVRGRLDGQGGIIVERLRRR